MNIRDLRYLIAVCETRSFSRAAQQCCISQPTLSNQIKKLEETLSVKLFERTNKHVMPTAVGLAVAEHAKCIMTEVHNIRTVAHNACDPYTGTFTLGAFPTLAPYLFPRIVRAITQKLPRIRLILVEEKTDTLIDRVHDGSLDAALLALPIDEARFLTTELFVESFLLAVPKAHPLSAHTVVSYDVLADYPLLLLEEGHCLRDQALAVCRLSGAPEYDFRATGLETLRAMVAAGTGITVIPQIARAQDPLIRYIPFAAPIPTRTIALVQRATSVRTQVSQKIAAVVRKKFHRM